MSDPTHRYEYRWATMHPSCGDVNHLAADGWRAVPGTVWSGDHANHILMERLVRGAFR